jgi:hypothetical protein
MGACAYLFIIFPDLEKTIGVEIYGAPIFLFELTMGLWLLFRRLPGSGLPLGAEAVSVGS